MTFNPDKHHRKSTRLKGYDYSQPGEYLVTIHTKNRACLYGSIDNGKMVLNDAGKMITSVWSDLPARFPNVKLDKFIVMPNRIHGIICIQESSGAASCSPLDEIVRTFISTTTDEYTTGVKRHNWLRFNRKLWQHNYNDHIIRSDRDLNQIREYIISNPRNWDTDQENQ